LIGEQREQRKADAMPRDVTNLVDTYYGDILYFSINFVWTHKYACCHSPARCQTLKRNRGQYIFERDPDNPFDGNAVKIMTHCGQRVGHIPRDQAALVAALMDEGKIDLKSAGGMKAYPCREVVEIVPLKVLSEREMQSIKYLPLERVSFDQNRYVCAMPRSLTV